MEVFVNEKIINVCEHILKMAPYDTFEQEPPGEGRGKWSGWRK